MDPGALLFFVGGAVIGIVLFFLGFGWFRQKRLIENMPTSKVRSIAMGPVEVYGEAQPAEGFLLKSPLSNKDCVYYRFTVEERRGSGKNSRWVVIKSGRSNSPFFLNDGTGSVLVDPQGANVSVKESYSAECNMFKDPPAEIQRFLKAENLNFESWLGINKQMQFTERIIAPSDRIFILGTADDNPAKEEATAQQGVEDVMIQKGKSLYLISDKPEKDILRAFKWKVIAGLYLGPVITVACLIVIFKYLGLI